MKNYVNWFEIYTKDFNRAIQFYNTVLGLEFQIIPMDAERHQNMEYALFPINENGGTNGALIKLDEVKPGPGGTVIYFETETIDPELSKVENAGGKIITPKVQIDKAIYIALVEDTEGNIIGLRSTK